MESDRERYKRMRAEGRATDQAGARVIEEVAAMKCERPGRGGTPCSCDPCLVRRARGAYQRLRGMP